MADLPEIKAYEGNEKYIFISYSHKDKNKVYPFIAALQKKYHVWFDEGIHFGNEWEEEIAKKLRNCEIFIYMITENSLASDNCKDELHHARNLGKNFINVLLDISTILPEWFSFRYGRYQMCNYYTYYNADSAIQDLERKCSWFNVLRSGASDGAAGSFSQTMNEFAGTAPGAAQNGGTADYKPDGQTKGREDYTKPSGQQPRTQQTGQQYTQPTGQTRTAGQQYVPPTDRQQYTRPTGRQYNGQYGQPYNQQPYNQQPYNQQTYNQQYGYNAAPMRNVMNENSVGNKCLIYSIISLFVWFIGLILGPIAIVKVGKFKKAYGYITTKMRVSRIISVLSIITNLLVVIGLIASATAASSVM